MVKSFGIELLAGRDTVGRLLDTLTGIVGLLEFLEGMEVFPEPLGEDRRLLEPLTEDVGLTKFLSGVNRTRLGLLF